jgi:sialic acid synthase SpsE
MLINKNDSQIYFIAEFGQNHQGSLQIAKKWLF